MKRVAVALTLLAACACAGASERTLARTRDEATLALRRGDLADALSVAQRGVALTDSRPDSPWAWTFRLLRSEAQILRREFAEALPPLSLTLPDTEGFRSLHARQQYLLARAQVAQSRLEEALGTLDSARQIVPQELDVKLDIGALSGQIHLRLGHRAEGESLLNAVAKQAEAAGDGYHQIWALNDLGMGRKEQNRFDEALPLFERVLSFRDFEQFTIYGVGLYNAGMCYARLGDFDRALTLQRRAVEIHERQGPRSYFQQALGELGGTYILQGDAARGLPYLERALSVASEAKLTADAALWGRDLAETYADLGQWDKAERFNEESKRLNPPNLANKLVWNTLTAGKIAAGRGQADDAVRLFTQAAADSDRELGVKWSAYAGLASVSLAQKQPERAARHFDAALNVIEKSQSDLLKTDYKLSYLNRLIGFYRDYVDALVEQGRVQRALEIADSSRGRVLADRQGVAAPMRGNAAAFQRVAKQSGTVLLSYWLAPARSYMWVVTPTAVRCLPLPPASQIEALVREYQAVIDNTLADPLASRETAGDRLFKLLVEPAARWIEPGARVIIVPDGGLHRLNFETLPVNGTGRHYWIEDVEIQIAPALALIGARSSPPPTARSLLLIGDPTPRAPEFPALSYASAEMTNVSRHFAADRVSAYQHERASPGAYRGARPARFTMIHFTAHATANTDSPLDSAIILSGPEGQFKLYARDVTEVPLDAELVTVSACRSAGERAYSGEGLVGFAWAFLRAGTRRVVAGLWDVDDRSTAELMDHFYDGLAEGAPPARALRDAKRVLLGRGGALAKPYYWAPFQIFTVAP
jgi:tetratricopeptide (TPR) repeat protein